ncbi:MAG: hypothetical protein NTY04_00345, partial [Candidatus Staskawiczbacteria bacterium]|nr:hypothetical protein [Candidatus Staskawiczbacteria bacterium]
YDITDITSDMLKKSLIPVVCGTGFSKELFERNVNVEWSYIIENTQKTFLVTITKDDCSQ